MVHRLVTRAGLRLAHEFNITYGSASSRVYLRSDTQAFPLDGSWLVEKTVPYQFGRHGNVGPHPHVTPKLLESVLAGGAEPYRS